MRRFAKCVTIMGALSMVTLTVGGIASIGFGIPVSLPLLALLPCAFVVSACVYVVIDELREW